MHQTSSLDSWGSWFPELKTPLVCILLSLWYTLTARHAWSCIFSAWILWCAKVSKHRKLDSQCMKLEVVGGWGTTSHKQDVVMLQFHLLQKTLEAGKLLKKNEGGFTDIVPQEDVSCDVATPVSFSCESLTQEVGQGVLFAKCSLVVTLKIIAARQEFLWRNYLWYVWLRWSSAPRSLSLCAIM